MHKGVEALAIGTFALGIAEFGMMGILGSVASDFQVSISEAGHLISAYSAGVAIGAPALVLLHRLPLRRLMLMLAAFIAIGNALAVISPSFMCLLCARFISGLPHGAFFGAGAIVCSRLAGEGSRATAVAVMVGGMTIANVVGVPLATFITDEVSWRLAFGIVSVMGVLAFIAIRICIPVLAPLPDAGFRNQFVFLRSPAPWLIYAGVFFGQMSVYCYFSYVEPVMTQVAGFAVSSMTFVMVAAGLGMVTGNFVSGRLADRFPPSVVSGIAAALAFFVMLAAYFFAGSKIISVSMLFMGTLCLFAIGGPLQYLIVKFSKGGEMLGGAGIQIAFNVSNAIAAALGGAAIHAGLGLASPALVGLPGAIIGASALFVFHHRYGREETKA